MPNITLAWSMLVSRSRMRTLRTPLSFFAGYDSTEGVYTAYPPHSLSVCLVGVENRGDFAAPSLALST